MILFDGGKFWNHEHRERAAGKENGISLLKGEKENYTWRKILHLLEPIRRIFMIAETTTVAWRIVKLKLQ